VSKLLRYDDLVARNIIKNRMTLKRWMEKEGFPLPIQLGPNTVAWCESKIEAWLASRQRDGRDK
jgi:predicted DNA-binding transcriptional regulator AlpA